MVNGDVNAQESNFDIFHACIWVGGSVAAAQNKKMTVKIGLKQYAIKPNITQGFNKHTAQRAEGVLAFYLFSWDLRGRNQCEAPLNTCV